MLNTGRDFSTTASKLGTVSCALLFLTACATGKSIKSVDDIADNGQSNTMLVSYDVTMNVTDKYARINQTDLVVNCGKPNRLGNVPECFRVTVPLKGRKNLDGYEYYSFSDTGAKLVQMPYGSFDVKSVRHNVVVDVERYSRCSGNRHLYFSPYHRTFGRHSFGRHSFGRRSRFFNHFDCIPFNVDITAKYFSKIPDQNTIEIGPGKSCYAGHLALEMIDGEITRYELDQNATMPSEEALTKLPTEFQQAIKDRGFERCAAPLSNT